MQVKAKFALSAVVALMVLSAFFFRLANPNNSPAKPDSLFSWQPLNVLTGQLYGYHDLCGALRNGNFGIGTFDGLDGEMIEP
jgi:hypothetical protein